MRPPAPFRVVITTSVRRWFDALQTADNVRRHHDAAEIAIAVVDDRYGHYRALPARFGPGPVDARSTNVRSINVSELVEAACGEGEYLRLAAIHPPQELVAVLRPIVLRHVAAAMSDAEVAVSLPDDAELWTGLDRLVPGATEGFLASVVRTTPIPRDGRLPDDVDAANDGLIDHETFALRRGGLPVLEWWIAQSARHPLIENDRMKTHEVRWLDRAVHFFPHLVRELTGITRSYRNADESLPGTAPVLRLVDFDASLPWNASPRAGRWPRVLLSEHTDLAAAALRRATAFADLNDRRTDVVEPFGHVAAGYRYDEVMRTLYRDALHAAERHGVAPPPNPFSHPSEFVDWLRETLPSGATRYLDGIRRVHDDVGRVFGDDTGALREWARTSGGERAFAPSLTGALRFDGPATDPKPPDVRSDAPISAGVNVVGLFKAEMGVGEAARLTVSAVAASGVPFSLVLDDGTAHRQHDPFAVGAAHGFRHDVNIIIANADALPTVMARLDQPVGPHGSAFRDLPTVGLWFWETVVFPDRFDAAFRHVDEVWVASEHVRSAVAPAAARHGVAVHLFPLGAGTPRPRLSTVEATRATAPLGVPADRLCFFFAFDHRSVAERKNPWGLIDAFSAAFPNPEPDGPVLVIKTISGDVDLLGRERLRWMAAKRTDIVLVEGFVSTDVRHALLSRSDVYISLHRAEGWGLTMAEAMALGIPTVATRYSGNLQFMTDANSWLIDCEPVPIPTDVEHYGGGVWAEPDLHHAAAVMRRFVDDPQQGRERVAQALADIQRMAAHDAGARFIVERLRHLRRMDLRARRMNMRAPIPLASSRSVQPLQESQ